MERGGNACISADSQSQIIISCAAARRRQKGDNCICLIWFQIYLKWVPLQIVPSDGLAVSVFQIMQFLSFEILRDSWKWFDQQLIERTLKKISKTFLKEEKSFHSFDDGFILFCSFSWGSIDSSCQYSSHYFLIFTCIRDDIKWYHHIFQYTPCSFGSVLGNIAQGTVFLDTLPMGARTNIRSTSSRGKH